MKSLWLTVASLSTLVLASAPALAAPAPATIPSSALAGSQRISYGTNPSSPQTVEPCGIDYLNILDLMKTSFVTAWGIKSLQGNIVYESIDVSVSPGSFPSQGYTGVGPVISASTGDAYTWYNLKRGTYYTAELSGYFETDNGTYCPVSDFDYVQM